MTDTFDFDFDVNEGGTRTREGEKAASADDAPAGNGPSGDDAPAGNGRAEGSGPKAGRVKRGRANGGRGNGTPTRKRRAAEGDGGTPAERDEDWLSLADDRPGEPGLESIAEPDDGPAGPRRAGEGRELAREARKRAARTNEPSPARPEPPGDFEAVLERQPQKSAAARRGAAVFYGLRGLLDDGRERLRGTGAALRGGGAKIGALKERLPDAIPTPAPGCGRGNGRGRGNGNGGPPGPKLPQRISSRRPRKPKPGRVKKLRLAIILVGLGALALVSTVFGMMMAVAGDLPQLESKEQYAQAQNSEVYDAQGRKMGTLLSNTGRILVESEDISPYVKQAVVAVEDQRFYEHRGVDFMGIGRAVVADVMPGGSTQGASTITMQFVKNALEAQGSRTYFQKLREAAYAYHLERQWDKDKILTQYLNTIYYGEGAYGIEAAARTYFGWNHPECMSEGADPCASVLYPEEAALLAGIINQPSGASPRANPEGSMDRRNLVLQKMYEQGYLEESEYTEAASQALPAPSDIERPAPDSLSPYFTEWLRQQLVDRYGAGRAFGGGLDVHTTLDLDMQEAAESYAYNTLAGIEPTASVVVIDNKTGGVKAMVGGNDFQKEPFNLATNGHRQPGSSFKPFTLITALQNGYTSGSTFSSQVKTFKVPNSGGKEFFEVHNYDDIYYGTSDLTSATIHSDNSIYAELGLKVGTKKIAAQAEEMGIQTNISTNPSMTLGAIDPGVTPLEMAYAYTTIAHDGERISGSLDTIPGNKTIEEAGPVAISKTVLPDGKTLDENEPKTWRAIPEGVADTTRSILRMNVTSGTGRRAQTGGDDAWGKTGTTENNGDAWFCGGTEHFTACVWVGHAQTNTPMETEYGGLPVDGGTFPAAIWSQVMQACESIYDSEAAGEDSDESDSSGSSTYTPSYGGSGSSSGSSGSSGSTGGGGGGGGGSGQSAPAPAPAPAPSTGGGTGGVGL